MLTDFLALLVVLSAVIWVPIILYHITHRAFIVLLVWLFIAPVVTNIVDGHTNPFFRTEQDLEKRAAREALGGKGKITNSNIKLKELLNPNRTLFGAFLLVFFLNGVVQRRRILPFDKTELWMSIFSLLLVTNALFMSIHLPNSMRIAVDAFIVPFLGYYVARRLVTSEERFRQLVKLLCYLGLFIIICCLGERLTHSQITYRLNGPFAGIGMIFVALTATFYAALEGTQTRPLSLRRVLLYGLPIAVLLTWTRGNWMAFLAGIWVFLFFGRRLINPSRKLGGIGVVLVAIPLMIIALQVLPSSEAVESRVSKTSSFSWRLERWMVGIQAGVKYPVGGIGLNNTRELFGEELGDYYGAHNGYVTLFAELGLPGFLIYLAIVGSIIRMGLSLYRKGAHPQDQWRGIIVVAAMVAFQTCAMFTQLINLAELGNIYVFILVGGVAGLYGRHYAHAIDDGGAEYIAAPLAVPYPTRV
jgi:O-antigen ligase